MRRLCSECGGLDFSIHFDDVTVSRMLHLMVCRECLRKVDVKAAAAVAAEELVKA